MDPKKEKAIFVGIIKDGESDSKVEEYLDELQFLAETAGVERDKRFVRGMKNPENPNNIKTVKMKK